MIRVVLSVLAALVMSSTIAASQAAPAPKRLGRIIGVYDDRTGNPIDSAEVRDLATGSSALTTATGTLSLFFVDTLGAMLRIRKVGYAPLTLFVDNAPELAPLTLTLEPIAQRLPVVVTTDSAPKYTSPALKGFEERRKTGFGTFIREAVLRKEENRPFANVIRAHVPSLEVYETVQGSTRISIAVSRRSQASGTQCPVDVYLDGVPVSINQTLGGTDRRAIPPRGGSGQRNSVPAPPGGTSDLNQFQVINLAAVEFHNAATVPVEYNRTGSGCGVLFLWTRER